MKQIYFLLLALAGMTYGMIHANTALAAHPGIITAAIESVDSFYTDSELITKDLIPEEIRRAYLLDKDASIKEIKSVEWTEEPSPRRSARLRSVVEEYMTGRINAIKKEIEKKENKYSTEGLLIRLNELKDENLGRLEKALSAEVIEKKEIRPIPIIDKPQQESPAPDEAPGIWYR